MIWLDGFSDLKTARQRAETALYAPLGMLSPLWIAFGAAASAGAAFWFMSRLAKPLNVEAIMGAPGAVAAPNAAPQVFGHDRAQAEAAVTAVIEGTVIEPTAKALIDVEREFADEVTAFAATETAVADDLMKLAGVGPKIAKALAERGVESFEQLAAWTQEDLAAFDAALDLRGRAVRADFIAQARKWAAGEV